MRLIDTSTYELRKFMNVATRPPYAILSHTWTENEVSLERYRLSEVSSSTVIGYEKIRYACHKAKLEGYAYLWYLWVDTCCIDKKSSAELSEAINSMWRWYRKSSVCFEYIADVSCRDAR